MCPLDDTRGFSAVDPNPPQASQLFRSLNQYRPSSSIKAFSNREVMRYENHYFDEIVFSRYNRA